MAAIEDPQTAAASEFDPLEAEALLERVGAADGRRPDAPPASDAAVVIAEYDGPSGALVALAWRAAAGDPAELYVDPAHRGRGMGRRLATRILADSGIWAHGTFPAAAHLAGSLGLRPARRLLQLRADLPAGPAPSTPAGVAIRAFRPGVDDAEFLRVNAAAFAWHPEQGRLTQRDLDAEMAEAWFDADGFFLAVPAGDAAPGGRILGFHWTKVHPADPPAEPAPLGEIYVLAVDPASPIRHLGGVLTAAGLDYLAEQGLSRALLYVEADNEPALRLYRRFGFAEHAVDTVFA